MGITQVVYRLSTIEGTVSVLSSAVVCERAVDSGFQSQPRRDPYRRSMMGPPTRAPRRGCWPAAPGLPQAPAVEVAGLEAGRIVAEDSVMDQRETWGQDRTQKGRSLLSEITALVEHARASSFTTTEYISKTAAAELAKGLDGATGV